MGRNEDFDNALWSQPRFEELSADASLLYIWSWTNPRCGMAGLYEVGRRAMTESKVTLDHLDVALGELRTSRFVLYEEGVLWVISRVKRLRTKSVQMAKAVGKDVARIDAAHPLRIAWLEKYGTERWLAGALGEAHGEPHPNLTRGSRKPDVDSGLVSLTRTSPEAHREPQGQGQGIGTATTSSQGGDEVDARTQITQACAILDAIPSWEPNEMGVENAHAMHPNVDLLQGCRLAVTWASDPSWEVTSCSATLRSALLHLSKEKPTRSKSKASNAQPLNHLLRTS